MHSIVGRAWLSTCAEHGAVTCIWLSSEYGWTSGHRKSHKIYTRVHRNCESGLVIIYMQACYTHTQAGPTQAAGHGDGMERWQHFSHLLRALPVASIALWVWSPVTMANTGTMSQATNTNCIERLPCSYVITLSTE